MRPLADYLTVRTPLLAIVDPDLRWSRRLVERSRAHLGAAAGPFLEWTVTRGWDGPSNLMHASGLTRISIARAVEPGNYLEQLRSWLASESNETDDRFPLAGGLVLVNDLQHYLDAPNIVRSLFELNELLIARDVSLVVLLTERLAPTHPLGSMFVQIPAGGDPVARYGDLAHSLIEALQQTPTDDLVSRIAGELTDLPLATAEVIIRFTALDELQAPADVHGAFDLALRVRAIRAEHEARATTTPARPPSH